MDRTRVRIPARAVVGMTLAAAAGGMTSAPQAAPQIVYGPRPAWVRSITVPPAPSTTDGAPVRPLLQQEQIRFGPDGDEFYNETVFRIDSPQGLPVAAAIHPVWNPETETLALHRFDIIRGGQTIDLLAGGKNVTVLRRETSLESAMLDGSLTATLQPEGLKVGDVIDFAATLTRHDPVYQGRSDGGFQLVSPIPVGRTYVRAIWPLSKNIRWKVTEGIPSPTLARSGNGSELVIDARNLAAPRGPLGAAARFQNLGQLALSEMATWADVATLVAPLYAKATTLAPNSPLQAEIRRISGISEDPKIRAAAALRLVQDQVRYAFIGMNYGGFTPADADLTWTRRFGDCKGKSALLVALLRGLGIDAQPVLISVGRGDGLNERLPMLGLFDHVIVRATIGGKVYWLDGTRVGDRAIDDIAVPDFHWALPILTVGAQIEPLEPRTLDLPAFESRLVLDATAGIDSPARAHAERILRGDDAVVENRALTNAVRSDADRDLRSYWRDAYSWIDVKTVAFNFDDSHRVMRLEMDGVATMDWDKSDGFRDFSIGDSSVGFDAAFKREPGPNVDAPFAVPFPLYKTWTAVISLPQRGIGFSLLNAGDIDDIVAGRHIERHSRIDDGVVTVVASEQTISPEFPAAEAESASRSLREMNTHEVNVRAPVEQTASVTPSGVDTPAPVTAGDFSRRAKIYLAGGDQEQAISDFTQAAKLDPNVAATYYNRGVAYFASGDKARALADFNHALAVNPADVYAVEARARLEFAEGQTSLADADLKKSAAVAADQDAMHLRHAKIFMSTGDYQSSVHELDVVIQSAPTAEVLRLRCQSRTMWGQGLEGGLADCDAALKLDPDNALTLNTRGVTLLRLNRFGEATKDFAASLTLNPEEPTALYGLGIAEAHVGAGAKSAADLSAAMAQNPRVSSQFTQLGLKP